MPLKIIETEKEGHRKVKTKEPKRYRGQKSDLYGTKTHKSSGRTAKAEGGPTGKQSLRDKIRRLTPKAWKRKNPFEALGGGEKAKPHSTKEGRVASGARKVRRHLKTQKPKTAQPQPMPKIPKWKRPERIMTPLRAKHGVGSLVKGAKKVIGQLKKDKGIVYAGAGVGGWELGKKASKKKKGRIRKGQGGSAAQQHYLQHGYGPHKSSGRVLGGKKVGIQIK